MLGYDNLDILLARTKEQRDYIENVLLEGTSIWWANTETDDSPNEGFLIDDWISFEELAGIVDYLRENKENAPFTIHWLFDNVDFDAIEQHKDIQFIVEDDTVDKKDAGCIDIIYCGQYFWCLCKGTDRKDWLVTASNEFRNDAWIPSVKTIADFKRLFRVATGFDLPLKIK